MFSSKQDSSSLLIIETSQKINFKCKLFYFVFISSEYLEYFFSSFNAQLNKAWQNNLIVLPEEKLEQKQHLSTQNARIQNSEVHKFSILLSFRNFSVPQQQNADKYKWTWR